MIVSSTPLTLKISLISPKLHFLRLLMRFFFQKKSAFISLSATFFYWWKTVLFFEISRKRALHHTVIILVFFSLPHLCPSMINWGKKLFQLISLLERIPSHFEFSFCMSEITKKNEKFEMTSFWTLSKARGLWGAEISSKSVITELTLSGHLRAESFNQIFGKKHLIHTTKSYKSSLRSSLSLTTFKCTNLSLMFVKNTPLLKVSKTKDDGYHVFLSSTFEIFSKKKFKTKSRFLLVMLWKWRDISLKTIDEHSFYFFLVLGINLECTWFWV